MKLYSLVSCLTSCLQSLESLLRLMKTVVERRTETKVLENCAKTLIVLCSEDHAIYSRCDVIRSTLFDYLDRRLRDVLKEPVTAGVSLRTYYFFLVYRNKLKHIYIFFAGRRSGVCPGIKFGKSCHLQFVSQSWTMEFVGSSIQRCSRS
jgi:hypothetical protein